jgi:hypothetical protein
MRKYEVGRKEFRYVTEKLEPRRYGLAKKALSLMRCVFRTAGTIGPHRLHTS